MKIMMLSLVCATITAVTCNCFALASGSDFLKLGLGARQVASGEIDLPTEEPQATSLWWNPALLANSYQQNLSFTGTKFLEDINYGAFSYSCPITQGALGFGVEYLSYGSFDGYDAWGQETRVSPSYASVVSFGYAIPIEKKFPYKKTIMLTGGALKLIQEKLDRYTATGFGIDTGLLWYLPVENLSISIGVKNIGTNMTFVSMTHSLPLTIDSGVFYSIPYINTTVGLNIASFPLEKEYFLGTGLETTILGMFSLRAGYRNIVSELGVTNQYLSPGLRVGAGIKAGTFDIDYAYVPWSDFGSSHLANISFSFGGITHGIAQLNYYLQTHLNDGKKYFYRKDYIRAREEFQRILDFYPQHPVAKEYLVLIKQDLDKMQLKRQKIQETYLVKANKALNKGNIINADKYLAYANELNPESLAVKQLGERLAHKREELRNATLASALEKKISIYWSKGVKYFKSSDFVEAKIQFQKILDINSDHEGAKKYIKKIDDIFSKVTSSQISNFYEKALTSYKQKDYDKAILYWQTILSVQPERKDVKVHIEKAQAKLVELKTLEKEKEKRIFKQKEEKELIKERNIADSLVKKGSYITALRKYRDIIRKAKKLGLQEMVQKTKSNMDRISKKLAEYHFSKGYKFYQQNKIEEAIQEFKRTLDFNPQYEGAKERLTTLRLHLKKIKKEQADDYYQKGLKAYNEGDLKQATDYWKKAVELYPGHEEAKRALERVRSYER